MVSAAVTILLALVASSEAFTRPLPHRTTSLATQSSVVVFSTTEEVPTTEAPSDLADVEIPTNLPSDCGKDYIPLATMLATGEFEKADQVRRVSCSECTPTVGRKALRCSRLPFLLLQFTRDALIEISGAKAKGRNFVYFTDVKNIPSTDLATMERLWLKFSNGKFGYSVQKKKWKQSKGDFEVFCRKIGWTTKDGEVERKKRWFGASEFTYDPKKAPEGHLPLTSALRGTSLIKNLLNHPVWDNDDWQKEP